MYIVIFSNQKTPSMNLSLVWVSLLCSLPIALFSQFTVEGTLIDYQTGAPVAAVHVMIKGSETGTVSDAAGYFSLPSTQSPVHLIFTHPAYFTHEQQMQAGDSLSIELFGRHLRSVDTVMTFDPETYEEQVTVVYYDAFPAANHQPHNEGYAAIAENGDFNVGPSNESDLLRLIEEKRKDNIYLTVLGFGMGNYKDDKLELLADHGNGNYGYIDNAIEAKKLLIHQMGGTLFTLAKDVKIQMEFNPAQVESYRLVGYENRLLNREDYENDEKDAGELGAGHAVTALYEIVPAPSAPAIQTGLRYQQSGLTEAARNSGELATLRVRYKRPEEEKSAEEALRIAAIAKPLPEISRDFRFAAAVAGFGLILRESPFNQTLSYENVLSLVGNITGPDPLGLRTEFLELVKYCREMGWEKTSALSQK